MEKKLKGSETGTAGGPHMTDDNLGKAQSFVKPEDPERYTKTQKKSYGSNEEK